jgi:tetratricopeptide (TPR) repeat protein
MNNDYDVAIQYYNKALDININQNDPTTLATIYTNLGNTFLEKQDLDSAEYCLNMGLTFSNLSKDLNRVSSVRIAIGKLFRAMDDLGKALENLHIGYDLAVQNSNVANIIIASQVLSELHYLTNDFSRAYEYFKQYRNYEDSLHNKSHLEKITRLEMKLLFDLENEIQQIQIQRNNLKYFTLAVVLVSLIIIVILLYGRQRIKIFQSRSEAENLHIESEQLQDKIDYKNRELATNVMFLVKKNELINFISEKLMKVKQEFKPSVKKSIDEILIDLQSNVDKNIWLVFADRFKEVHKGFYKNLMDRFPNLSDNDKKLCAFIRLDMNTKEIAAILLQNPNSIEVARTRLRKKLNISNTDISLNSFLSKF